MVMLWGQAGGGRVLLKPPSGTQHGVGGGAVEAPPLVPNTLTMFFCFLQRGTSNAWSSVLEAPLVML